MIRKARSIPEPGQTFTFHGFRFRVLRRDRNRSSLALDPGAGSAGGRSPASLARRRGMDGERVHAAF